MKSCQTFPPLMRWLTDNTRASEHVQPHPESPVLLTACSHLGPPTSRGGRRSSALPVGEDPGTEGKGEVKAENGGGASTRRFPSGGGRPRPPCGFDFAFLPFQDLHPPVMRKDLRHRAMSAARVNRRSKGPEIWMRLDVFTGPRIIR